ncbi:OmpA family protein [Mariniflexile fucanivorans]|uniref:OmpA family protein n=1 Tax=Mariniflexile fucanivorans TaxID=264023 RepID=A0A4R1RRU7_9FLAO|nr:OmpA family protein [Mariniflexile fucanivorans]TCL69178.1 OmpA family protein [Mariniflexile fucanivorans]
MALKHIIIVSIALFTIAFHAQNKTETTSVIRMSEEDLQAVIGKIVEAKKRNMREHGNINDQGKPQEIESDSFEIDYLNKEIEALQKQINATNLKKTPNPTTTQTNNNLYLRRDIEDLEFKINELRNLQAKQNSNEPITIIIEKEPLKQTNTLEKDSLNVIYKQKLQYSIDSLSAVLNNKVATLQTSNPDYSDDLSNIEKKLIAIQSELNLKKASLSKESVLLNKYSSYKNQIFFKNNSKSIEENQFENLNNLVKILNENKNFDVLVKGFASKKGSAVYNQSLSMERTETIKKYLISKGIHPTRILTINYGIDYKATTDDEARRVEISLVIRK